MSNFEFQTPHAGWTDPQTDATIEDWRKIWKHADNPDFYLWSDAMNLNERWAELGLNRGMGLWVKTLSGLEKRRSFWAMLEARTAEVLSPMKKDAYLKNFLLTSSSIASSLGIASHTEIPTKSIRVWYTMMPGIIFDWIELRTTEFLAIFKKMPSKTSFAPLCWPYTLCVHLWSWIFSI